MLRDLAEHPERLLVETVAYRLAPLIEPHEDYLRLGRKPAERQATYRDLFRVHINPEMLKGVRQATQSNRVFGADYFQTQIEAKLALRIAKQKRDRGGEKLALGTAGIIILTPNSPTCAHGRMHEHGFGTLAPSRPLPLSAARSDLDCGIDLGSDPLHAATGDPVVGHRSFEPDIELADQLLCRDIRNPYGDVGEQIARFLQHSSYDPFRSGCFRKRSGGFRLIEQIAYADVGAHLRIRPDGGQVVAIHLANGIPQQWSE